MDDTGRAKFNVGDKVILNGRTTKYAKRLFGRNRARTITRVKYHPELQATVYYLGNNHRGDSEPLSCIPFRSYQLKKASGKRGRPRLKRKYVRHSFKYNSNVIILADALNAPELTVNDRPRLMALESQKTPEKSNAYLQPASTNVAYMQLRMRDLLLFIHDLQDTTLIPRDIETQRLLSRILTEIEKNLYSVEV